MYKSQSSRTAWLQIIFTIAACPACQAAQKYNWQGNAAPKVKIQIPWTAEASWRKGAQICKPQIAQIAQICNAPSLLFNQSKPQHWSASSAEQRDHCLLFPVRDCLLSRTEAEGPRLKVVTWRLALPTRPGRPLDQLKYPLDQRRCTRSKHIHSRALSTRPSPSGRQGLSTHNCWWDNQICHPHLFLVMMPPPP